MTAGTSVKGSSSPSAPPTHPSLQDLWRDQNGSLRRVAFPGVIHDLIVSNGGVSGNPWEGHPHRSTPASRTEINRRVGPPLRDLPYPSLRRSPSRLVRLFRHPDVPANKRWMPGPRATVVVVGYRSERRRAGLAILASARDPSTLITSNRAASGGDVEDALFLLADVGHQLLSSEVEEELQCVLDIAAFASARLSYLQDRKKKIGRLCPGVEAELKSERLPTSTNRGLARDGPCGPSLPPRMLRRLQRAEARGFRQSAVTLPAASCLEGTPRPRRSPLRRSSAVIPGETRGRGRPPPSCSRVGIQAGRVSDRLRQCFGPHVARRRRGRSLPGVVVEWDAVLPRMRRIEYLQSVARMAGG